MQHLDTKALLIAASLGGFALPAAAQDICGGSGQWIGGGEGNSDIATADSYREQMALVLSGNEYVSVFSLSAPASVRVEAAGRGNGDPLIELKDADGAVLMSDDDSGGNGAARIETDLDAGTYCMSLVSYDGRPMTAFVRVGLSEMEPLTTGITEGSEAAVEVIEDTPDTGTIAGSCSTASPLGTLDGPITGTGSAAATPFWSFTLAAPSAVTVTASNENADPIITLYDASENYLGENDDFDGLNSRLDMTETLPAGDYCIQVDALSDKDAPIEVAVDVFDPQAALEGLIARGETSPPLDGSYPITGLGVLENRLRQDVNATDATSWFSVEITQPGLMLIEAIAAGSGDPWLVLFDDLGRQIALNDDFGSGYDSQITARVSQGTYLVGVRQVSSGTQGIIRMVFERYVPAP